jgi:hypothetical protein
MARPAAWPASQARPPIPVFPRSTALPNGLRVRVRLPHGSDRGALRDLHERAGIALDELALIRLLRVDPRRRYALVATAWVSGAESVVGFADCDVPPADELGIVTDPAFGEELRELLGDALLRHTSRVA